MESYKGVNGHKVTGKPLSNGKRNSIFLPAAGCRYGTSLHDAGSCGNYWSGTLYSSSRLNAWSLNFNSGYHTVSYDIRYTGFTVRPVK